MVFAVAAFSYYDGGRSLLARDGPPQRPGRPAGGGYAIPEDCPADRGYIESLIPPIEDCEKSASVGAIAADYEKTWGYFRNDSRLAYAFFMAAAPGELEELKASIGYYNACLSLAEGRDLCGSLVKKRAGEEGLYDVMYLRCYKTYIQVGLAAYAAGYAKDEAYCGRSFNSFLFRDAARSITEKEFCGAARQGFSELGRLCGGGAGLPCANIFPEDGECRLRPYDKSEAYDTTEAFEDLRDCRLYRGFFEAFGAGTPAALPPDHAALYAAFAARDGGTCGELERKIVKNYCSLKHRSDFQLRVENIRAGLHARDKKLRLRAAAGGPAEAPPR